MSEVTTEGMDCIPTQPVMIFPNRVNLDFVRTLEQIIGAPRLAWLVHYDDPKPDEEVMQYLTSSKSAGGWISLRRMGREMMEERVQALLKSGRYVVLLPARPAQQAASLTDVSAPLLQFADGGSLPVLPVYVGMYNDDLQRAICSEAPYERLCVQFLPIQAAGNELGSRVRGAWMEAAAHQVSKHSLLRHADLRQALSAAFQAYPQARVIDGVNDSHVDYETLFALSLLAARRLAKETLCTEVGIILPPGKLCIIANLACLFAGIIPVNFNYTATGESFRAQVKASGVTRFITEHRFTQKQHAFAWPRKLDQIFIDDLLYNIGSFALRVVRQLIRWGKADQLFGNRRKTNHDPEEKVTLFFTKSPGASAKGVAATHRMLYAAVMQLQSRLQLRVGERVLSVTPFYESHGFVSGFILPLLCGLDIVTYPDMDAAGRIGVLCRNFGPTLAAFSVPACYGFPASLGSETFSSLRHCLVTGARIPSALQQKAQREFQLALHNAYTLAESTAPIAMGMNAPEAQEGKACLPADAAGSAGCPLVGTAVRIVDTEVPTRVLPPKATGVIWLRSATLPSSYFGAEKAGSDSALHSAFRDGWFCTGDIGMVDDEGMLHILGRSTRFSKVDGVVISHELVEEVILSVLKQPTNGPRKIAVVPDGERLVLLSTIHRHAGPQDVLTLRYAIANARYSIPWPDKIISVSSIPVLPNGQPDYPACLAVVHKAVHKR